MKKGSHKNQIVITSLALLLAVVGYISYDNKGVLMNMTKQSDTQAVSTEVERVAAELNTESILNAGETILTSNISQNADYAAQVKLDREQVRSKNRESLQAIIDNETLSEAEKQGAVDAMAKLTQNAQMEADAEMLLEAKGFEDVVVSITDDMVDVVVNTAELTEAQRAQIEDIIVRKTGMNPEAIVISTLAQQ